MAGGVSTTAILMPACSRAASALARSGSPALTKWGVGARRAFHQWARDPCGSVSIKAISPAPARAASTARWPDRVVLPEPPFWDAATMVYIAGSMVLALFRPREGQKRNLS